MHANPQCPNPIFAAADVHAHDARANLGNHFARIREATRRLAAPLSPEDCTAQSMTEASPVKWHLAHTTWFFETFILEAQVPDYTPFNSHFRFLFNSYYNAVGSQHPRPQRGLVTRPGLAEVHAYRRHVDEHMLRLLEDARRVDPELTDLFELGLHHEQQHQELILTDLKHLLSFNPLQPAYHSGPLLPEGDAAPLAWQRYPQGLAWLGHAGQGFCFDNELPRHRAFVEAFDLARRPVTNAEYLEFIQDGGYQRPELWLSEGWDTLRSRGWRAPLYWEQREGTWHSFTLSGPREIDLREPVCHISYYEADAFARWAGARLPTEAEWELAASAVPVTGNFVEAAFLHPVPAVEPSPLEQPALLQLFGDVWEWTRSPYAPYPRYRPPRGALGEYNGKFMCNQMVLRGGSCAAPATHIRRSYRNFFPPDARWQFSGMRLARDV